MTAADELRKLLDERKADYRVHQGITNGSMSYYNRYTVLIDGSPCAFIDTGNGDEVVLTLRCTPEQAITATLGYGLNPDGLPAGLTISDDGALLNWRGENYVRQAIAATLGRETCKWQYEKHGPLYDVFSCSACKYEYAESRTDSGATDLVPNYCPNCGRVVEQ